MNLDDQRPAFLMHYVGSLAVVVAGLIIKEAWLAGFGSALMFTWVIRARRM